MRTTVPARHGVCASDHRRNACALGAVALLGAFAAPVCAAPLGLRLEAGYNYSDNVTRAPQNSPDVLSDQSFGLTVSKNFLVPLTTRTRLIVNGFVGGERFVTYDGLSRLLFGAQGTYQFRPSGSFGSPTYAVFLRTAAEYYDSNLRDGYRYAAGVSVRKPVTDRIQVSTGLTYNYRDSKSAVFDNQDWSARVNLDYSLRSADTLYFGGEYRRGDTVSTARPSLAMLDLAKSVVSDDAFDDGVDRLAYRFKAATWIGTVGYNLAFTSGQSLDFSYRYIRSTPTDSSSYTYANWNQTIRYVDNQFGLAYLLRF